MSKSFASFLALFIRLKNKVASAFLILSPTDLYLAAFLPCFSNSINCSLYVCSISDNLSRLSLDPFNLSSASCRLLCKPLIFAASSSITLLSSGLESIICAILPCPTMPEERAPVPLSAKISCISLALTCLPLTL